MTLKSNSDLHETKITFRSKLKGIFGKPFSKQKPYKNNDCDLTFDALPDFSKQPNANQVKENQNETYSSNNLNNKTSEAAQSCENNKNNSNEDSKENNSEYLPRSSEGKDGNFQTNSKESSPILSQTSVVVNGGVGIHFGNVYNNVNNLYYNGCISNTENVNRVEKTEAIKDLLKCANKVETGHLELLSSHFGDKWQEIGVTLGFTVGELHCLKNQNKELKERAFQMLMMWSQKRGNDARVGELCKILWRCNVDTAREAVRMLSLNINLFN